MKLFKAFIFFSLFIVSCSDEKDGNSPKLNRAFMVGTNSFDEKSFIICDNIIGELIEFDQESP